MTYRRSGPKPTHDLRPNRISIFAWFHVVLFCPSCVRVRSNSFMVVHTLPVFQETRELSDFQKFETFFRRSQLRNSCTRRRKRKLENGEEMRDILRYLISFAILAMLFYISSSSNGILLYRYKTKIIASLIYTSMSINVSYPGNAK